MKPLPTFRALRSMEDKEVEFLTQCAERTVFLLQALASSGSKAYDVSFVKGACDRALRYLPKTMELHPSPYIGCLWRLSLTPFTTADETWERMQNILNDPRVRRKEVTEPDEVSA